MKKLAMIMVILLAVLASGQAQEKLKVGDIKNGKLLITETSKLKAFLMNSL